MSDDRSADRTDRRSTGKLHTRRSALKTLSAGSVGLLTSAGAVTLASENAAASDHVDEWSASDTATDTAANNWSKQVTNLKLEYIQEEPSYYDYLFTLNGGIVGRNEDDHSYESHCIRNHGYRVTLRSTEGEWSLGEINDTKQHYPDNSSDPLPNESLIEEGMDFAFDLWDDSKLGVAYTAYQIAEKFGTHSSDVDKEGKIKWGRSKGAFSPYWTDVGHCHQIIVRVPKDSSYHSDSRDVHIQHWADTNNSTETRTEYELYMDSDGGVPGIIWG
ncbi:hypothetical protein DMJ13_00040 [halophilic archaeon]|nr:hypothetical protein DMJ13_00040 [halophilic archaeon]